MNNKIEGCCLRWGATRDGVTFAKNTKISMPKGMSIIIHDNKGAQQIGKITEITPDERGLWVTAELDHAVALSLINYAVLAYAPVFSGNTLMGIDLVPRREETPDV